ncbi:MAG: CHAT domain-containing protein, partial [Anaerolineales bacterium]
IYHYQLALTVYNRQDFAEGWAMTQYNLAMGYFDRIEGERAENIEQAIHHAHLAQQVYTISDYPDKWALTHLCLADTYRDRIRGERADNIEQAIQHSTHALAIFTRKTYPHEWALTQNHLGANFSGRIRGERADNIEQAIYYFQLALEIHTLTAYPRDWAMIHFNLASAYHYRIRGEHADNLEMAIQHCHQALQVYTRQALPLEWGGVQNSLAVCYCNRILGEREDNLEQAIDHFQKALEIRTREASPIQWANTQFNLAIAFTHRVRGEREENFEQAIYHYQQAQEVYSHEAFSEDWARIQGNLAAAYTERIKGEHSDNIERAIHYCQQALKVFTLQGYPEKWATTQNNFGEAYRKRILGERTDNIEQAIYHYQQALKVFDADSFPIDCRRTAYSLGQVYVEKEDWASAHTQFEIAIQAADVLYQSSFIPESQQREIQTNTDLFDDGVSTCMRLKDNPSFCKKAMVHAEEGKARTFLEQMGQADYPPPADVPKKLIKLEGELLDRLRNLEYSLTDINLDAERKRELAILRRDARNELNEVWQKLEGEYKGVEDYLEMRRAKSPSWEDMIELAEQLGRKAVMVLFYMMENEIEVFILRDGWDAPKVISLPITQDELFYRCLLPYEDEILNFRPERIGNRDWISFGEKLLAPLDDYLEGVEIVYFIPHDLLHIIPLHALNTNGEPFIKKYQVAYAPSAGVLMRTLRHHGDRGQIEKGLFMGFTPNELEKQAFYGEAKSLANYFGSETILDTKANKARLGKEAGQADLIHLSCHGSFNPEDPLASPIMLADGEFTARDWMGVRINSEMVTLSACRTGFSEVGRGDEIVGMTRSLLYAGTRSVLVSLWSVNAISTMMWMEDFYKTIWDENGNKMTQKAKAFQQATLNLMKEFEDPYYWAPFILVGDGN